jgi:hypothetical protein
MVFAVVIGRKYRNVKKVIVVIKFLWLIVKIGILFEKWIGKICA